MQQTLLQPNTEVKPHKVLRILRVLAVNGLTALYFPDRTMGEALDRFLSTLAKTTWPKGRVCGVYIIHNVASGRSYVGSALHVRRRWHSHIDALESGSAARKFQASWNKHGKRVFRFALVERCSPSSLTAVEQKWIDKLDAAGRGGYNTSPTAGGSNRGIKYGPEFREKARLACANRVYAKGRKHSEAELTAMRAWWASPAGIAKRAEIGERTKGATWKWSAERRLAFAIKGGPSAEVRAASSERLRGKPWSAARRAAEERRRGK